MAKKKSSTPKSKKPALGGPYIHAALFCEKVLREQDEIATLVRIYDTFIVSGVSKTIPTGSISTAATFILKRGDGPIKSHIKLIIRDPDQKKLSEIVKDVSFPEEINSNCFVQIPVNIFVKKTGSYPIDVVLNGKRVNRLFLGIRYSRAAQQ
jgi:hypothetical protein